MLKRPADTIAEPRNPHWVDFDGDHVDLALRKSDSYRAETSAELDDEITGAKVGFSDDTISEFRTKEILTETASSLVPRCPQMGGHGRSPSWA